MRDVDRAAARRCAELSASRRRECVTYRDAVRRRVGPRLPLGASLTRSARRSRSARRRCRASAAGGTATTCSTSSSARVVGPALGHDAPVPATTTRRRRPRSRGCDRAGWPRVAVRFELYVAASNSRTAFTNSATRRSSAGVSSRIWRCAQRAAGPRSRSMSTCWRRSRRTAGLRGRRARIRPARHGRLPAPPASTK